MEIRKPFHRERVQTPVGTEVITDQSWRQDADVNYIVERYKRSGHLPKPVTAPVYADVSGLQGDLTERLNWASQQIEDAQRTIATVQAEQEHQEAQSHEDSGVATDETTPPDEPA